MKKKIICVLCAITLVGQMGTVSYANNYKDSSYSINYDGEVIFELDRRYSYSQLIDHGDNSCTLIQDVDFDVIGDSVCIIAKDKNTNATIDMIVVNVRGN